MWKESVKVYNKLLTGNEYGSSIVHGRSLYLKKRVPMSLLTSEVNNIGSAK